MLIASVIVCNLAGVIGSLFTVSSIPTWYASLNRPWFSPPNWVFGPVWITLYTLMGISLYLVWSKKDSAKVERNVFIAFFTQLILNALWSIVFFGLHSIAGAFIVIILLWLLITATILLFWRHSKTASILMIPYIIWVSFATILNFSYMTLN